MKSIAIKILNFATRTYCRLYGFSHPIEKKVIFKSFDGRQYSDNPRAISEKLHELYPDYKIVWILDSSDDPYNIIPSYVHKLVHKPHSLSVYREISTAFCVVSNTVYTKSVAKKKGQIFIQTWHGDIGPKKILFDIPTNSISAPLSVEDRNVTDYCIAGSDFGENLYRTAFRYQGVIIKNGMPRNDVLINGNKELIVTIKERLGLPINRKILLYAPTYRDNNRNDQLVNINLQKTIDVLNKREDNWICLIRAHVASAGLRHDYASSDILDVSKYPDMADLLLISDMLITDYSSAAADFILCRKPTILAFFDYEEYTSNCRDLNYSFEDAGFLIARNQEELEKIIFSCNSEDYINNCNKIIKYFNVIENGNSSDAIVKIIDQHFTDLKQ